MKLRQFGSAIIAGGLMATPALAQTMSPTHTATPGTATPGTATPGYAPGSLASPNAGAPNPDSPGLATNLMGDRVQQTHGGYLSSKLVGATVYNDQNQSIGSIDNLIVGENGQVSNVVISVGGFLGIGSKLVNVPFAQLKFKPDGANNGREVVLPNATRQSLQTMQAFTYSS